MKKLVLSFVLMIAGLVAIAQENDISKKMVRDDYHLCFIQNNEVIPDVELQKLLSEDVYNSYQTGRVLYKVGNGVKTGGWIAFGAGMGLGLTGLMLSMYEESQSLRTTGAVMYVVGISAYLNSFLLIPSGYILRGIGAGKISRIAEEYNQNNQSAAISYHLSPSVMPVNVPQSQGNMAYGMTFSVNF